jgi:hypothetical protein
MRGTKYTRFSRRGRCLLFGAVLALLVLPASSNQTLAHAADGHPARIHEGTCDALGQVDFSLTGVGASIDLDQQPLATPVPVNPATSYQVVTSETTIPVGMDDLLSGDHAVMIYNDDQSMQGVACGNVGGAMMGDTLVVGLAEMGVPGHSGFALFRPDGDQTDVTILIGHALAPVSASGGMGGQAMGDMGNMDMATPAP